MQLLKRVGRQGIGLGWGSVGEGERVGGGRGGGIWFHKKRNGRRDEKKRVKKDKLASVTGVLIANLSEVGSKKKLWGKCAKRGRKGERLQYKEVAIYKRRKGQTQSCSEHEMLEKGKSRKSV